MIVLCAVLCGADDFVAIAAFGRNKRPWHPVFSTLALALPPMIALVRFLPGSSPEEFARCLGSWVTSLAELTGDHVLAIDGNTCAPERL